jgi:poly(3-hydroxybutyrate) depolymerase
MFTLMKYIFLLIFLPVVFINCSKKGSGETTGGSTLLNLSNIEYGSNKDTSGNLVSLKMDLYFPPGASMNSKYPLTVMIHGGAYLNGDKADLQRDCQILADSGFVVASINYRLGWRAGNTTCGGDPVSQVEAGYRALQDANAALRFLVANANQYGIDTGWIFIGGTSAGSSIALNTVYIPNPVAINYAPAVYAHLGPVNNAGNPLTNEFKIKGICNMWGALPDSNLITANSAVPTISFHGTSDNVVPYDIGHNESCSNYIMLYGSACIHRRLVYYHQPVISNFVIGGGHGPSVYTPEFLMNNTTCFFNKLRKAIPVNSAVYTTLTNICN